MKNNINYYWHSEFKNAYDKLESELYTVNSPSYDNEIGNNNKEVRLIIEDYRISLIALKIEIDNCKKAGKLAGRYQEFANRIYNIIGIND